MISRCGEYGAEFMNKIVIKQAHESDIPVLESILLDTVNWLNDMEQPLWGMNEVKWDALSRNYQISDFYIAYSEEKPSGCMALIDYDPFFWPDVKKGESLFIHKLAVTKEARKSGVADSLIDFFKEQGMVRGVKTLRLDTHALRPRLRAFYERHGFVFVMLKVFKGDRHTAFYIFTLPALQPHNQENDKERQSRIYPIILSEYNPAWADWFAEEKANLERLIGAENIARISHFGSTSVPGLTAKSAVDILLEIKDDANVSRLISALLSPEYICLNPPDMPTPPPHLVFLKGYLPDGFAEKVYHIHVRYLGAPDEFYFRDYLIAHPDAAAEYAELKRRLFQDYEHDRDGYTEAKTNFIRSINRKTKEEL
jgi:GrpB-like predicted nucleotidyltransferase (UPF0157 family)/GNAT superfamily N-acetyltransferase